MPSGGDRGAVLTHKRVPMDVAGGHCNAARGKEFAEILGNIAKLMGEGQVWSESVWVDALGN